MAFQVSVMSPARQSLLAANAPHGAISVASRVFVTPNRSSKLCAKRAPGKGGPNAARRSTAGGIARHARATGHVSGLRTAARGTGRIARRAAGKSAQGMAVGVHRASQPLTSRCRSGCRAPRRVAIGGRMPLADARSAIGWLGLAACGRGPVPNALSGNRTGGATGRVCRCLGRRSASASGSPCRTAPS